MRSATLARLLNPFDGPGTCTPKKLVDEALRSLGDGPPAGGPSQRSARGRFMADSLHHLVRCPPYPQALTNGIYP